MPREEAEDRAAVQAVPAATVSTRPGVVAVVALAKGRAVEEAETLRRGARVGRAAAAVSEERAARHPEQEQGHLGQRMGI